MAKCKDCGGKSDYPKYRICRECLKKLVSKRVAEAMKTGRL